MANKDPLMAARYTANSTPRSPQKRPRCLDPDTNSRLARQRSHCSCFTKRQLLCSLLTALRRFIGLNFVLLLLLLLYTRLAIAYSLRKRVFDKLYIGGESLFRTQSICWRDDFLFEYEVGKRENHTAVKFLRELSVIVFHIHPHRVPKQSSWPVESLSDDRGRTKYRCQSICRDMFNYRPNCYETAHAWSPESDFLNFSRRFD